MTGAPLVVALANARADRRPSGARRAYFEDALRDAESATQLLQPFLCRPVEARELKALRAVHRAVVPVVNALIDGELPPLGALNAMASRQPAVRMLERRPDGKLGLAIRSPGASAAGLLMLEVVRELGELDPSRLRRCERPECRLVFYDATRSATQRWHAESPCGLRERQLRYRAARADGAVRATQPPPGPRDPAGGRGAAR